jgi:glycosyltransferase involved in cell wall biosynthesis
MPAYNAAQTIRAAILSVLAQTFQNFELIIVDDESDDETLDVVEGFQDSRIHILACEHQGLAATRNSGIWIARGTYVSFLDSDDLWLPRYLDTMRIALEQEPEAAMAYTDAWLMDDVTRRIGRSTAMAVNKPPIPPPSDPLQFLTLLLQGNFIFVSATVRRSVLMSVGGFDATLAPAADYDLWLRVVARGHRAVRPAGIHAIYRKRRGSLSTDRELMLTECARIYRKLLLDEALPAAVRDLTAERERDMTAALERRRSIRGKLEIARGRVGELSAKVRWRRYWYPTPPKEVAAGFPDLRRV